MKKTKLSFSPLRIAVVAALTLAVLALTGCDNGGGGGGGLSTVTFNANSGVAAGQVPASQAVTRGTSIMLPGQGGLVKAGYVLDSWNTRADGTGTRYAPGSFFTVPGNVTLFAIWLPPVEMTITITGIPSGVSSGGIHLMHPGTMHYVDGHWVQITGGTATLSVFAISGTYDIHFRLGDSLYTITKNLTAGANTIPFANFIRFVPVTITVTGIPNQYIGQWIVGNMFLFPAGTSYEVAGDYAFIASSSATFSLFVLPETYDIKLWFGSERQLYTLSSRNLIAGTNTIPFSAFTRVEPITITVTGIPNRYDDGWGEIEVIIPGIASNFVQWYYTQIDGPSAIFTVFVSPGTYDIELWFEFNDGDEWMEQLYTLSSRNLTAGNNTIPFSAFTRVEPIIITITGIPNRYDGWGDIDLRIPGTWYFVGFGEARIVGPSVTFSLFNIMPGTYDIKLELSGVGVSGDYFLSSRTITAGTNTIPFSAFTITPSSFTETLEHSEQPLPARSRARACALRAS